jgi:hypothetical protein
MAGFALWPTPFTDDITVVPASFLEDVRVNMSRALNIGTGGSHTPAADAEIVGPNGLKLMGSLRLKYQSRSIVRRQPLVGRIDGTVWNYDTSVTNSLYIRQDTASAALRLVIPLINLPHGGTLTAVTLEVDGGNGHAADPIASPPLTLGVVRVAPGNSTTSLGSQNDTTTRATFEAVHNLTVSGLSETIDLVNNYYIATVIGEGAGTFVADNLLYSLSTTCSVTEQSEY